MPKRKHATDDFDYIKKKMKNLKRARRRNQEISSSSRDSTPSPSEDSADSIINQMMMDDTENIPPLEDINTLINNIVQTNTETTSGDKNVASNANSENVIATSPKSNDLLSEEALKTVNSEEHIALDSDILEILGVEYAAAAAAVEYGKEIHKELASRLEHISITGLTKESRKELKEKYLLPSNGTLLGAPLLNPEIKAALPETLLNNLTIGMNV